MADVRIALREQLLRKQPRTVDRGRLQVVERELARLIAEDVSGFHRRVRLLPGWHHGVDARDS
jgi:hypothetical protein